MRPAVVLLALLLAHDLPAQTITGTVYDPTGATVAGARVLLMADYVKLAETTADEAGEFRFEGLKPQLYHVQIKQPRFALYQSHANLTEAPNARIYAVLPMADMRDGLVIRSADVARVRAGTPAVPARRGGHVEPARLVRRVPPAYPQSAKDRGVAGTVVVYGWLKPDGAVTEAIVLTSPDPDLSSAALASVNETRYAPMRLNGSPVSCEITLVFEFAPE